MRGRRNEINIKGVCVRERERQRDRERWEEKERGRDRQTDRQNDQEWVRDIYSKIER